LEIQASARNYIYAREPDRLFTAETFSNALAALRVERDICERFLRAACNHQKERY
jgi:hypothetical protein